MLLIAKPGASATLKDAHSKAPLYGSIQDMCEANRGKPFPKRRS